jgi:hypothetical protein
MTVFHDFNFKLLVIEKLMYWDQTLSPAFSLRDHMRARGIDDLDAYVYANELDFTVLPEPRAYFQELEIPVDLLATVEELTFDGGHRAFMECAPVWDGEDDLFDVRSLDDLDLVPNLKLFTNGSMLERMLPGSLQILSARGIVTRF